MAKINIFTDSIVIDSLFHNKLDDEILKELNDKKQDGLGVVRSNQKGFQTEPISNKIICECILQKSVYLIYKYFNVKPNLKYSLANLWINENYKNSFNVPHNHPDSSFSGAYYVETKRNGGELVFLKNDKSGPMAVNEDISNEFCNTYKIQPLKNQIILFPSNLEHMVYPHFEESSRISISFNINVKP
jgi:hypothetical protein|tara:strand:- start:570 stop:1133 length:564 start_codon:yes stop_codon:yes gene_type:complete